ncbi:MAG: hypothetical protein HY047_01690 [Acidobacteria bacterium]|nr:hypothetical protein [Acidobacteriota bacterium]
MFVSPKMTPRRATPATPESGASASPFSIVKTTAFKPMPSVRTAITVNANAGLFARTRNE